MVSNETTEHLKKHINIPAIVCFILLGPAIVMTCSNVNDVYIKIFGMFFGLFTMIFSAAWWEISTLLKEIIGR